MLEKSDMIWKSYMFNLKKGTLKFLFNSCLDTLPTQTNLLQRGKSASDLCKLCLQAGTELQGRRQETTNHILNGCKRVLFVIGKYKPHIGFVAEIQAWQWFKPAFRPTVLEIGDLVRLSWVTGSLHEEVHQRSRMRNTSAILGGEFIREVEWEIHLPSRPESSSDNLSWFLLL